MFAYLHHLYMDFAQPQWLQVTGQLSSYLISVPAAVVTIFSTLVLVYGSNMRWRLPSLMLFLGVMGWAIGGVAAVIDSTVAVNTHFHNTLWVPAHFHTYYVMGVVLMILGTVFHLVTDLSKLPESAALTRAIVGTVGVGGYGFVLMFYLARRGRRASALLGVSGRSGRGDAVREGVAGLHHGSPGRRAHLHLGDLAAVPQGPLGVRTVAALAMLTCTAAPAAAQPAVPRDAPPSEERLLNAPVPDIRLTTAAGARVRLSQIARWPAARADLRLHALRRRLLAVPDGVADGRSGPRAARRVLATRAQLRPARHAGRHVRRSLSISTCRRTATGRSPWAIPAMCGVWRRRSDSGGTGTSAGSSSTTRRCWRAFETDRLVRLLVGGSVTSARLDELVREVSGEFVRSYPLPGRVPFRCVQFDAATGRMTLDWGFALLLVPVATTGVGTFAMFAAGARARRKST